MNAAGRRNVQPTPDSRTAASDSTMQHHPLDGSAHQRAHGRAGPPQRLDGLAADVAGGSGDEDHRSVLPKWAAAVSADSVTWCSWS
ncbi:hypothetical protein [Saccharothrix luteola]|uniref:hypothetical protein n=1 Tax=Saccharothrix luteola TaxID=2893018 RepID=UPI001E5AB7D1|nr:hypothetical protein [Saccharothrix luteola]MCC8243355.1 hypothetical protein [Saccharothrix luteola]